MKTAGIGEKEKLRNMEDQKRVAAKTMRMAKDNRETGRKRHKKWSGGPLLMDPTLTGQEAPSLPGRNEVLSGTVEKLPIPSSESEYSSGSTEGV
ncbi:hypothetical protein AGIG_G8693 [Arapaima gigas]